MRNGFGDFLWSNFRNYGTKTWLRVGAELTPRRLLQLELLDDSKIPLIRENP